MNCPVCERDLADAESECPECGIAPTAGRELIMRSRALGWSIGLVLGVGVSFLCLRWAGESTFFYTVWILPPALGAICGEAVKSQRLDQVR